MSMSYLLFQAQTDNNNNNNRHRYEDNSSISTKSSSQEHIATISTTPYCEGSRSSSSSSSSHQSKTHKNKNPKNNNNRDNNNTNINNNNRAYYNNQLNNNNNSNSNRSGRTENNRPPLVTASSGFVQSSFASSISASSTSTFSMAPHVITARLTLTTSSNHSTNSQSSSTPSKYSPPILSTTTTLLSASVKESPIQQKKQPPSLQQQQQQQQPKNNEEKPKAHNLYTAIQHNHPSVRRLRHNHPPQQGIIPSRQLQHQQRSRILRPQQQEQQQAPQQRALNRFVSTGTLPPRPPPRPTATIRDLLEESGLIRQFSHLQPIQGATTTASTAENNTHSVGFGNDSVNNATDQESKLDDDSSAFWSFCERLQYHPTNMLSHESPEGDVLSDVSTTSPKLPPLSLVDPSLSRVSSLSSYRSINPSSRASSLSNQDMVDLKLRYAMEEVLSIDRDIELVVEEEDDMELGSYYEETSSDEFIPQQPEQPDNSESSNEGLYSVPQSIRSGSSMLSEVTLPWDLAPPSKLKCHPKAPQLQFLSPTSSKPTLEDMQQMQRFKTPQPDDPAVEATSLEVPRRKLSPPDEAPQAYETHWLPPVMEDYSTSQSDHSRSSTQSKKKEKSLDTSGKSKSNLGVYIVQGNEHSTHSRDDVSHGSNHSGHSVKNNNLSDSSMHSYYSQASEEVHWVPLEDMHSSTTNKESQFKQNNIVHQQKDQRSSSGYAPPSTLFGMLTPVIEKGSTSSGDFDTPSTNPNNSSSSTNMSFAVSPGVEGSSHTNKTILHKNTSKNKNLFPPPVTLPKRAPLSSPNSAASRPVRNISPNNVPMPEFEGQTKINQQQEISNKKNVVIDPAAPAPLPARAPPTPVGSCNDHKLGTISSPLINASLPFTDDDSPSPAEPTDCHNVVASAAAAKPAGLPFRVPLTPTNDDGRPKLQSAPAAIPATVPFRAPPTPPTKSSDTLQSIDNAVKPAAASLPIRAPPTPTEKPEKLLKLAPEAIPAILPRRAPPTPTSSSSEKVALPLEAIKPLPFDDDNHDDNDEKDDDIKTENEKESVLIKPTHEMKPPAEPRSQSIMPKKPYRPPKSPMKQKAPIKTTFLPPTLYTPPVKITDSESENGDEQDRKPAAVERPRQSLHLQQQPPVPAAPRQLLSGKMPSILPVTTKRRVKHDYRSVQFRLDFNSSDDTQYGWYSGPLVNEEMHGNGVFWFATTQDRILYLGEFYQGELHGFGALSIQDANDVSSTQVLKGIFEHGEYVGEL